MLAPASSAVMTSRTPTIVQGEARVSNLSVDVDMRGVDRLSHALQQVSLTIDDALRPPGAAGREQDASGFVHAQSAGRQPVRAASGKRGQTDDARGWRNGLDAAEDILSSDDQALAAHPAAPGRASCRDSVYRVRQTGVLRPGTRASRAETSDMPAAGCRSGRRALSRPPWFRPVPRRRPTVRRK